MGKYAAIIIGPAGSGKSTLCRLLQDHYNTKGRGTHVANFDPAAEDLLYEASLDVRDLISLEDVMDSKHLGPNGGLVFCMEYIVTHGATWLMEQLGDFEDDFLIVDMPGQVEVLANEPAVPAIVQLFKRQGYYTTIVYALDALATTADGAKFIAGCMFSLSSMVWFDCPFINVLTKCDLLSEAFTRDMLEHFCMCDFEHLDLSRLSKRYRAMVQETTRIISEYHLVSFRPMNPTDDVYVQNLCSLLDETLQVIDEMEIDDRDVDVDDEQDRLQLMEMLGGKSGEDE